jgi:hypothetical protein
MSKFPTRKSDKKKPYERPTLVLDNKGGKKPEISSNREAKADTSTKVVQIFVCKWKCGKKYETLKDVKEHQQLVHMTNRYPCRICKQEFIRLREMKYHLAAAHDRVEKKSEKEKTDRDKHVAYFASRYNKNK